MNLSISIREYLEKSKMGSLSESETVSSLGLVAFERKKFLKSLRAIEIKFQKRLKEFTGLGKMKAKQGMELILKQCKLLFKQEWVHIVDQYNQMRNSLYTAEQRLFLSEAQKFFLERETTELKQFMEENFRQKVVELPVEDFGAYESNLDGSCIDELGISEANSILENPFSFYGSYLMTAMHKKKDILADAVVKKLLRVINHLQEERKLMELDREAVNNVATLNFDLAQNDADRIKEQAEKIEELEEIINLNKRLVRKEKQEIVRVMTEKYKKLEEEYNKYRSFAEQEIEVAHRVIERQQEIHKKLFAELKATKTILEVPKLRDMLPKTNQRGMDFNEFTKKLGEIYKTTVENLYDKTGVEENPVANIQSPRALRKAGKNSISPQSSVLGASSKAFFGHKTTAAATSQSPKTLLMQNAQNSRFSGTLANDSQILPIKANGNAHALATYTSV